MIKIIVIAPYEEFGELFRETFREHDEKVHKEHAEQSEYEIEVIVEYRHETIQKMKLDCNVVIARGFSAQLLGNMDPYAPVVEIPVTANDIIRCLIESRERYGDRRIAVIGTVKGDMHDIGKNLVIMMLEGAGYRVVDLGIDVPAERFIQAFDEHKPQVVGLSALLTTTMPQMQETVEELRAHHDKVMIAVGGAPVTDRFARETGADGYAADAAGAVDIVAALAAKA